MGYTLSCLQLGDSPLPWNEKNLMSLRAEFVTLARTPGVNISELCRRFGISRKTGYKWLQRATDDLGDRSRRPRNSPGQTSAPIEQALLEARDTFPDWGARKLKRFLRDAGVRGLPAVSTITAILRRHGRICERASEAATPWQRFEHEQPNALWQMDFKGHFALISGRCHALTVLDDHSRYNLILQACTGERFEQVQPALEAGFRRYGLPARISCDNGPPWGTMQRGDRLTRLGAWLIRLGIRVSHARPYHPQTNGKGERFHRTLQSGLLQRRILTDHRDAQRAFDTYRQLYNHQRPHDALGLDVPANRFRPSLRPYPETLPPIEYPEADAIRKVDANGCVAFRGAAYRISRALRGNPVALRPDPEHEGVYAVYFCHQQVRVIDLNAPDQGD